MVSYSEVSFLSIPERQLRILHCGLMTARRGFCAHRTLARLRSYDNCVVPECAFRSVPKSFERAVSYLLDRRCDDFTPAELAHSETQHKASPSLAVAGRASLPDRAGTVPVETVKVIRPNHVSGLSRINVLQCRKRCTGQQKESPVSPFRTI